MKYNVTTFRQHGFRAFWGKTPNKQTKILLASYKEGPWFYVDLVLWQQMREHGLLKAYHRARWAKRLFYLVGSI